MGWRGSAKHWHRYEIAYLLLAGLSTPLVLSVHSIVSFDFSVAQLPGWHATIFPPYFVAGAIFAGFAMVLILCIPLRHWYGMEDFITKTHLIFMGKVMLATGLIVVYGYAMEGFFGWYSANEFEVFMIYNRVWGGPYWWFYWLLILCNGLSIQLLWFKRFRESEFWLFFISIIVSIGMWLERFVIIVTSLHRDFLPSSWAMYSPTVFDWSMFIGTLGFFFTLLFLFVRFLPVISIFEVRTLLPGAQVVHGHGGAHGELNERPNAFNESINEAQGAEER
jgi:molybdopterin-containing oxidoreductase family membrane subunit